MSTVPTHRAAEAGKTPDSTTTGAGGRATHEHVVAEARPRDQRKLTPPVRRRHCLVVLTRAVSRGTRDGMRIRVTLLALVVAAAVVHAQMPRPKADLTPLVATDGAHAGS